jgi:hypothetical protein
MEMSARQMLNRTFWKVFNVAARLVAIQFFVAALLLLIWAIGGGGKDRALILIVAVVFGTFAIGVFRMKAFRPDIDGFGAALGGRVQGDRAWWTGSIKRASGSHAA